MTGPEEQALLREYFASLTRLAAGFAEATKRVAPLLPMNAERIDALSLDDDASVIVFIKRFEQFEDALHRTLKAISKIMEHGKIERLTSVDVTRRAFSLGILPSAEAWANAVRARNTLAHEYPINPGKRVAQLNTAWENRDTLSETWTAIQSFVALEGLLDDRV